MAKAEHVLAIDQGTTSSRAIVFDRDGRIVATVQREFTQHYPQSGWVEHDADIIWNDTVDVSKEAIAKAGLEAAAINAIGIKAGQQFIRCWEPGRIGSEFGPAKMHMDVDQHGHDDVG